MRMQPHRLPARRAVGAVVLPAERDAGVVGCNEAAMTTALQSSYGNQLTVVVTPQTVGTLTNVLVTVTSSVTIMTPLISAFFPKNPYPVVGTCTMLVEQ